MKIDSIKDKKSSVFLQSTENRDTGSGQRRIMDENENHYLRVDLGRQRCIHDETKDFLYFWLRRGAYLTVGRKFGWNPPPALGVNRYILEYAIERGLKIRVFEKNHFDRAYEAEPRFWIDLNATEVRKGIRIYFYPWKWFKTILAKDDPTITVVAKFFQGGC